MKYPKAAKEVIGKPITYSATLELPNVHYAPQVLGSLGIDSLLGEYVLHGLTLKINGTTQAKADIALSGISATAVATAVNNAGIVSSIHILEQSIDTSRMRREVFEGMRKQVAGVSPTAAEAWSIAKVQTVDNEIAILRAKLK